MASFIISSDGFCPAASERIGEITGKEKEERYTVCCLLSKKRMGRFERREFSPGTPLLDLYYATVKKDIGKAREMLSRADVIFVVGGNTYTLLGRLRRSGLDEVLKSRINEKKLVFCGASAGGIVWCDYGHSDSRGPRITRAKGLGMVPIVFSPHFLSDGRRRPYAEKDVFRAAKEGLPIVGLERADLEVTGGKFTVYTGGDAYAAQRLTVRDGNCVTSDLPVGVTKPLEDLLK